MPTKNNSQWPHLYSSLHEKFPTVETWNLKAPSKDVVCTFSLTDQIMCYLQSGDAFLFLGTCFVAYMKKRIWHQHHHQKTNTTFLWLSYYIHSGIEYQRTLSTHLYISFSVEKITLFAKQLVPIHYHQKCSQKLYWILVRKRLDYYSFSFFSILCSSYVATRSHFFHFNSVCDDCFPLTNDLTSDPSSSSSSRSQIQFQLNLQILKEYLHRLNYHHLIPHISLFVNSIWRQCDNCPCVISCITIYLFNSSG